MPKETLERMFTIAEYLYVLISLGTLIIGGFWLFLKTALLGFVVMVVMSLFLPKESADVLAAGTLTNDNTPNETSDEASQNADWDNDYKTVKYDEDETYDNFYMQREDEYREEYGDDFEDAIDDGWEERRRK